MSEWSDQRPAGEPSAWAPPPPPAPPAYGQPPSPYGAPNQYGAPSPYGYGVPYGYASPTATTDALAIVALILGILGFATCPLVGIAAVVLGHLSRKRIRESNGAYSGDGLALAGLVLGWIQVGLCVAFALLLSVSAIAQA